MIAALYVETNGVYYGLPDVDPWDEERDARLYDGPWPVVAHPPCSRWCRLAGLVEHCYGYKRHEDGGAFAAALDAVRRFGGVLEHPAYTDAWWYFDLPRPGRNGWTQSLTDPGWTTEVSQSTYGSPVRKRTWLYYVGPPPQVQLDFSESRELFHDRVSWLNQPRGKGMSHGESSATPPAFRDVLLDLARSAVRVPAGEQAQGEKP